MHERYVTDERGDTVEVVALCSDACHRDYCESRGVAYEGWNGCHEAESTTYCAQCGVVIPGLEDACKHQRDNVVVNRFRTTDGEKCRHGNWVQLPASLLTAV